jgi:hypothetical protein
MTTARRDAQETDPYFEWLRAEASLDSNRYGISVTNNDHWVHRFSSRVEKNGRYYPFDSMILIEVKSFDKAVPFAQSDTLELVDQLLKTRFINGRRRMLRVKDKRPGRSGCYRYVLCYGKHILRMSGSRPDRSEFLYWDDKRISLVNLLEIYRFERDPDHPSKIIDMRRHHLRPASEQHPVLPGLAAND